MSGSIQLDASGGDQVVAAIDLSAYTDSVSHYAAWAARRLAAPLTYLHVLERHAEVAAVADYSGNLDMDERTKLLDELVALDEARGRIGQERGRRLLQQASDIAAGHDVAAQTALRHGVLVDTLLGMEDQSRLFVLGKRGENADFATGHPGSQLERVVRAVHRPLLVASRQFNVIQRVLIAFDNSATTRKGVAMVAGSPLFEGLQIQVLMVGAATAAHREGLAWALDTLATAGRPAEGQLLPGEPETILAQHAHEDHADLLVMGAYGHSRIRRLIVGSTTTTLLRTGRIPTLLLR